VGKTAVIEKSPPTASLAEGLGDGYRAGDRLAGSERLTPRWLGEENEVRAGRLFYGLPSCVARDITSRQDGQTRGRACIGPNTRRRAVVDVGLFADAVRLKLYPS
jgi:hypothetical protein